MNLFHKNRLHKLHNLVGPFLPKMLASLAFFKTCEFKSSFPRGKKEQKDEKQEHSY